MAKNEGSKLILPKGAILTTHIVRDGRASLPKLQTFMDGFEGPCSFVKIVEKGMDWGEERLWLTFEISGITFGIAPEHMGQIVKLPEGDYTLKLP